MSEQLVRHGPLAGGPRPPRTAAGPALRLAGLLAALYGFLLSVSLMEAGFDAFGAGFSKALISATANPFVALVAGVLATSIVQSSSCTTSIIVSMVASGTLTVSNAVPMVMGANIGTTVTNTLVSLGCMSRKEEFRRAFAAATVHDFFNLLTTAILLPVELATGYLQRTAVYLTGHLAGVSAGSAWGSPLKPLFRPVVALAKSAVSSLPAVPAGVVLVVLAGGMLFACLFAMMRLLRGAAAGKTQAALDRIIGSAPALGLLAGALLTAVVQSSSIVTSMLVPLVAAGILQLEQAFAITLGANIGTTVTAILASLAVGPQGLTIALVHLLFNVTGVALFFPVRPVRRVPIWLARRLADLAARSRGYALAYTITVFYGIPGLLVLLWRLLR
ncbi:MAG TPA: Na/Pi symporter [Phycisphaerae bacterium]|nr:Na/Pi symporter [Phycisphaerae bacterium]